MLAREVGPQTSNIPYTIAPVNLEFYRDLPAEFDGGPAPQCPAYLRISRSCRSERLPMPPDADSPVPADLPSWNRRAPSR